MDVMFSVSLPTASQNSLLVVQSSSPAVRAQFAGWFVYAMSGQGYNVNAEIMNITTKVGCSPCRRAGLDPGRLASQLSMLYADPGSHPAMQQLAAAHQAATLCMLPGTPGAVHPAHRCSSCVCHRAEPASLANQAQLLAGLCLPWPVSQSATMSTAAPPPSSSSHAGAIAGDIVGGLAALALVSPVLFLLCKLLTLPSHCAD